MRIFAEITWGWGVNGLWTTAIFSVFAGFFGNFRDKASTRYTVRRQLFSDPKMHDLE